MKEKIENLLLQNISIVIGIVILILWSLVCNDTIEIEYGLTSTGVIFAFWYGYKKYERDKELEIINNLSLNMNSMDELIHNWHIQKILHDKNYTKKYIWKEIEQYYIQRINKEIMMSEGWVDMNWEEIYIRISTIEKLLKHKDSKVYFKGILSNIFIPKIQQKFDFINKFDDKKDKSWSKQRGYFKEILEKIQSTD